MNEISKEMLEKVVDKRVKEISEHTLGVLIDEVKDYGELFDNMDDKQLGIQLTMMTIVVNTSCRLCVHIIREVLGELLCDDEKQNEPADESNEIILDAGQSLTIKKDNQRIEINDDGVMVVN